MATLHETRAKAAAHDRRLEAATHFLTVADLAARWACSTSTVRAIPAARLPYTPIGRGAARTHRRYDPADVRAYEQQHGAGAAA